VAGTSVDLVPLWTAILGVGVFFYVLLDGFDLGVGILYGFAPKSQQGLVMNSIAPVWDGNETWLILGGVGLLAAFPLAFAIIIPAVYFPVLAMLLGLVFRGVAFEFQFKQPRLRRFWSVGFCVGSGLAAFSQGAVLGTLIQGIEVSGRSFAGGSFDWLTPFTVTTGVALMLGYALLGAGWLIIKGEGELQSWAREKGRLCFLGVMLGIVVVSVWTPLQDAGIAARWFNWPGPAVLAPIPLATLAIALAGWRSLNRDSTVGPFAATIGLFLMSYIGIGVSLWPFAVPRHYTLWDAASAPSTQVFLAVGTLFLLPIIITYTAWSYWVFRGKLRHDIGYH
jgi:cytochrome d ubiquinol oxidase subunit II